MKVLSFIIPSYNSELYLDKCLASFVDEQIVDKLDVIIVNDGSTDNTSAVADKYCSMYPDSFRLITQENKGHGGALNTGCTAAAGKYLKVVDADDWVSTENLRVFVGALEALDSDVVLTHHYTHDILTGETKKWMCYPEAFGALCTMQDIVSNWNDFSRSFTFHGITYNTFFYKKCNHLLPEKVFYEDHEYSTFPACFAETVAPIDIFIYNYRIGDVQQSVSDKNRIARLGDMETVLKCFVSEFGRMNRNDAAGEFVCQKAKILLISYLTTVLLVDKNKKYGRAKASDIMSFFKKEMPRVYDLSVKQYKTFRVLNLLGIRKHTLDKLINSKFYHNLKGTHGFN